LRESQSFETKILWIKPSPKRLTLSLSEPLGFGFGQAVASRVSPLRESSPELVEELWGNDGKVEVGLGMELSREVLRSNAVSDLRASNKEELCWPDVQLVGEMSPNATIEIWFVAESVGSPIQYVLLDHVG
jgi:hypothetical protein